MATLYRRLARSTSGYKDVAAPYNTSVSGNIRPRPNLAGKKLLDQFRDKMRSLLYALATEKSHQLIPAVDTLFLRSAWELTTLPLCGDDSQQPFVSRYSTLMSPSTRSAETTV